MLLCWMRLQPHIIYCRILCRLKIYLSLQMELKAASMGLKTICTGGEMTPESFSYVGTDAEKTLRRYNADIAFFSCRGISEDGMITDNSILENSIRQIMIKNSRKRFLLCDNSKLGRTHLNTLCHKNELDGIISDSVERQR